MALLAQPAFGLTAADFTDWNTVTGSPAAAYGTVHGTFVSFSGTSVSTPPSSRIDGSSTVFNRADFLPPLPTADAIQIIGATGNAYTLKFGAPVTDPVLHLGSLASTLHFPVGTAITRLSGDAQFAVVGSDVVGGVDVPNPSDDANGSVRLAGTFASINFATTYAGSDGIYFQLGEAPPTVPEILSVSPARAMPGDLITVSGRRLLGGRLLVGGVETGIVSADDTRIVGFVPYLAPGPASVTVVTSAGTSAPFGMTVEAPPPQPLLANTILLPLEGTQIYYDSTLAADPDGTGIPQSAALPAAGRQAALGPGIRRVSWRFGDGKKSRKQRGVHRYRRAGSYRLTLKVTPKSGRPVTVRRRVAVGSRRPRRTLSIAIPSQVVFDSGKSQLRPASGRYLLGVARILRRARSVIVGGYTDSTGPSAFNRSLTLAQAKAVRAFLVRRGRVKARVLRARGYGETGRFGSNRTAAGRQRNRRIVLRVRFPKRLARISAR